MPEQLRQHLNVRFFSSLLLAAVFLASGLLASGPAQAQEADAPPADAQEYMERLRQEQRQEQEPTQSNVSVVSHWDDGPSQVVAARRLGTRRETLHREVRKPC